MNLAVTQELKDVCARIVSENRTEDEWAEIESDDAFQTKNLVGGFDATERAFCFSWFYGPESEYWFQVSLDDVKDIVLGRKVEVDARPAEK